MQQQDVYEPKDAAGNSVQVPWRSVSHLARVTAASPCAKTQIWNCTSMEQRSQSLTRITECIRYLHREAFLQPETTRFPIVSYRPNRRRYPPPGLFVYMIWETVAIETPWRWIHNFANLDPLRLSLHTLYIYIYLCIYKPPDALEHRAQALCS